MKLKRYICYNLHLQKLMKKISKYWQFLSRIGTDTNTSYLELNRVYLVNIIAIVCTLPSLFFAILNLSQERWFLSLINFSCTCTFLSVIILQYFRKHEAAKIILLGSSFILFFITGLLYRNGGEYFLLSVLIIAMLLYDNMVLLIVSGIVICCAIAIIYAFPNIRIIEDSVPLSRAVLNRISSFIFIAVVIAFFKYVIFQDKKQIESQRLKLENMNREKEKIFSIIAHDMRAPLVNTAIIIDIFQENTIDKQHMSDFIEQLKKQLEDQNNVLESILAWSSNKMKGLPNRKSLVTLDELISNILVDFKMNYVRKGITINYTIDKNIQLLGDVDHFKIVFRNLINNAIKFSFTDGQINISATEDSDYVYIHIQDYGLGIDKTKLKALFDQVQQRSLGTANEPGSGMGLMFCKELIELNNGIIQIESTPNKGSTFTIRFPKLAKVGNYSTAIITKMEDYHYSKSN